MSEWKKEQPQADADAFINEFCSRLTALLENSPLSGLRHMGADGKENLRAIAEAVLGQMNVVSRKEFEEQNAVLAQAVEKLADIEDKLAQLEKKDKTADL